MSRTVVLDVNETLLDLDALRPFFARRLHDPGILRQWFAEQILYSGTLTLTGGYTDFGTLAVATLRMVAQTHGVTLSEQVVDEFRSALSTLPAHDDVVPALTALRGAGLRVVALTNSAAPAARAGLASAGILDFFTDVVSVDSVRRAKPAPEVYAHAARHLGARPRELRLVACHTWDVIGALACGWSAALVTRPGNAPLPLGAQPDIVAPDLVEMARQIVAADG